MIRGGPRSGRIAGLLVCAGAVLAIAAPSAAGAPAVDEYTLNLPGSGNTPGANGQSGNPEGGGASASGAAAGSSSTADRQSGGDGRGSENGGRGSENGKDGGSGLGLDALGGEGGGSGSVDPSSRSAPAVVADTLVDSAMLPVLAALLAITAFGAWRLLRGRGLMPGQPD